MPSSSPGKRSIDDVPISTTLRSLRADLSCTDFFTDHPISLETFRPKYHRCSAPSDIFQSSRMPNLKGLRRPENYRSEYLSAAGVGLIVRKGNARVFRVSAGCTFFSLGGTHLISGHGSHQAVQGLRLISNFKLDTDKNSLVPL